MAVQITQEMISEAIKSQNKYGVPASVTLAQVIHESSGNYPGGLSGLAYEHNNYFGIMKGSWDGATVQYDTRVFRKYGSMAESFDDHGKLLTYSIYRNKTDGATSLQDYVYRMSSVYCPDSDYGSIIMGYINKYNLTQYDNGSLPDNIVQGSPEISTNQNPSWTGGITSGGSTNNGTTSGTTSGNVGNQYQYQFDWTHGTLEGWNQLGNSGQYFIGNQNPSMTDKIFSSLTSIIVVVGLIVLSVILVFKAFNVTPNIKKLIPSPVKKLAEKE